MISFWLAITQAAAFIIFIAHTWAMRKKRRYTALRSVKMDKANKIIMVATICIGSMLSAAVLLKI